MKKIVAVVVGLVALVIIMNVSTQEAEAYNDVYYDYCVEIGEMYGLCPELLQAIMYKESSGNSEAYNNGCIGLCQINPRFHQERMERLGVTDLYDPYSNLLVCADILMEYAEKYEDLYCVLMCYNEGEYGTAIDRYEDMNYSSYAESIIEKTAELERAHGK